eukprot:2456609-Rhodomonas_salina.2
MSGTNVDSLVCLGCVLSWCFWRVGNRVGVAGAVSGPDTDDARGQADLLLQSIVVLPLAIAGWRFFLSSVQGL